MLRAFFYSGLEKKAKPKQVKTKQPKKLSKTKQTSTKKPVCANAVFSEGSGKQVSLSVSVFLFLLTVCVVTALRDLNAMLDNILIL